MKKRVNRKRNRGAEYAAAHEASLDKLVEELHHARDLMQATNDVMTNTDPKVFFPSLMVVLSTAINRQCGIVCEAYRLAVVLQEARKRA